MVSNPNHSSSVILGTGLHLHLSGALQANTVRILDFAFTIFVVTLEIPLGHVMERDIYCTNIASVLVGLLIQEPANQLLEQLKIFERERSLSEE